MKRMVTLVLGLALTVASSGLAQGPEQELRNDKLRTWYPLCIPDVHDFTGGGARAQGMGKAFLAISDDISAVSWNPAGLFGQDKPMLGLTYGAFSPKGESSIMPDWSVQAQSYEKDDVFGGITMLSFLAPIRIKGHPFVGGASYTRADDEYYIGGATRDTLVDWFQTDDIYDSTLHRCEWSSDYYSSLDMFNIGLGTRLYGNLSFGFAANIYIHKAVSNQRFTSTEDSTFRIEYYDKQALTVVTDTLVIDTSSYSGVNFTIGFKHTTEKLSAALIIKTPFTLTQTTDRTVLNDELHGRNSVIEPVYKELHFDNIITKIEIPVEIGVGIGYRPSSNLLLALDAQVRPFSDHTVRTRDSLQIIPGERDKEYYTEYNPNWENVFAVRTGGEYIWETGSSIFPVVPIRTGFSYVPIPASGVDASGMTSTSSATSFSIGTGVRWTQIHIDLAYTYTLLDRDRRIDVAVPIPVWNAEIGEWGEMEFDMDTESYSYDQELKNRDHRFGFTFTGYF